MRNIFFFALMIFLLLSCNSKNEEVLDFDDLSKGSKNNYELDSSNINEKNDNYYYDSLNNLSKELIDSLLFEKKNIHKIDTLFFPDRFGAKKSDKWYFKTNKDSLTFFYWEFQDSIKTYNTFYNWLDCYGKTCKSIRIGDKIAFSKRAHSFLIQENHIFYLESNLPIDFEKILNFFDSKKWPKNWKFIINQLPRKKAEWMTRNLEGEISKSK